MEDMYILSTRRVVGECYTVVRTGHGGQVYAMAHRFARLRLLRTSWQPWVKSRACNPRHVVVAGSWLHCMMPSSARYLQHRSRSAPGGASRRCIRRLWRRRLFGGHPAQRTCMGAHGSLLPRVVAQRTAFGTSC